MTAVEPQVRHDARCQDWRRFDFGGPECTCRDTAGYQPVVVSVPNDICPLCEQPADWAIGDEDRACTEHLGAVAAFVLATGDGAPLVIEALAVAR